MVKIQKICLPGSESCEPRGKPAGPRLPGGGGAERWQVHPGPVQVGWHPSRHAPAPGRLGGAAAGTPQPRWVQVGPGAHSIPPDGYRRARGPAAARLRRGLGQQPRGGSWGWILTAKKVRLIVWCALYDLQSCKICRLPGVRLIVRCALRS